MMVIFKAYTISTHLPPLAVCLPFLSLPPPEDAGGAPGPRQTRRAGLSVQHAAHEPAGRAAALLPEAGWPRPPALSTNANRSMSDVDLNVNVRINVTADADANANAKRMKAVFSLIGLLLRLLFLLVRHVGTNGASESRRVNSRGMMPTDRGARQVEPPPPPHIPIALPRASFLAWRW